MPSQIPLDPKLPANFDDTPNSERTKKQLDEWWDHPYGITKPDGSITVRCLNGGAWDRSSVLGNAGTYEEACVLAHDAQAKWIFTRQQPIFMYSNEPPFRLVVQSQRPDYEESIVGEFNTIDEMNLFSLKQKKPELLELPPTIETKGMDTEALTWYGNELDLAASRLEAALKTVSVLRDEVSMAFLRKKGDAS